MRFVLCFFYARYSNLIPIFQAFLNYELFKIQISNSCKPSFVHMPEKDVLAALFELLYLLQMDEFQPPDQVGC